MEHRPFLPTSADAPVDLESTARGDRSDTPGDALLSGVADDFGFGGTRERGDPLLGAEVAGVRILRLLGEGGMGRVYEGLQERPSRRVAVKFVRPELVSEAAVRRLEREANVLATLEHPAIARVFAAGVHRAADARPLPYMILEVVTDGRSITAWARERSLDEHALIAMLVELCDAVAHAHERGVVHRDLKPGNVLVDASGRLRLVDFGVASWIDPTAITITATGRVVGTPAYMSPEQREGRDVDARADVYALGVLAAELLTRQSPAQAQVAVAGRRDRLARCLKRCLEIDPGRRYASAAEFAADLRQWLKTVRADRLRPSRRPALVILLVMELAVIAALMLRGRFVPPVSKPVLGPAPAGPAPAGSAAVEPAE